MAARCARKTLQISSASAKTLIRRSTSSPLSPKTTRFSGLPSSNPATASQFSVRNTTFFRLPVELAGVQSLMPLHSVTASALFTSLLSLHNVSWGCLSEGFATPL